MGVLRPLAPIAPASPEASEFLVKLSTLAPLSILAAGPLLWAAPALADEVKKPETGLVLASGEEAPLARDTTPHAPARTAAAWQRFLDGPGAGWRGYFDADTGAPGRVWGPGLPAPGSMASAAVAERHARAVLARHLELWAPGAKIEDLALVTNHTDGKMRTLGFVQSHRGIRVHGGQVSFRFKNDRLFMIGSEAVSDIVLEPTARPIAAGDAQRLAGAWIARTLGVTPEVQAVKGRLIVALGGGVHRDVLDVRVRTRKPAGLYAVYLDAATGEPVARRQLLMFTNGQVSFNVPVRRPGGVRVDRTVPGLSVSLADGPRVTSSDGLITWTSSSAVSVQVGVSGPLVRVANEAGAEATTTTMLAPGSNFVWNESRNQFIDAQLTAFVASQDTKAYVRRIAPSLTWLDQQLLVTVNMDDVCNAYSDGETTNFFQSGQGCENTARLPDVVAHETGHAVHFQAILEGVGSFDTALSEGASDYLAATMVDDAKMGRGFFMTDAPLRDLDPDDGSERVWPTHIDRDPHGTGEIIGGALWDLRKAFVTELGAERGVALTDAMWYAILQRASDIPSSYPEALAVDDDDGDITNGTPHLCTINVAFGRHGLVDRVNGGPGIGVPTVNASTREISFPFMPRDNCPGSEIIRAQIQWVDRANAGETGTVDMILARGGGRYAGFLPVPASPRVYRYRVEMTFDDNTSIAFPDNPADPSYEAFVGEVIPLYCTDFESNDPVAEGWMHALEASMPTGMNMPVDDWQWGTIRQIANSGDPVRAASGRNVVGNDLGQGSGRVDGRYQGNTTTAMYTQNIDTQGHTEVHLQYRRWLTVEDGLNDQASIYAGGQKLWTNLASEQASDPLLQGLVNHLDKEWRFHDVDVSSGIVDGHVQVKWELTTNRRRSYGGWTLDDVCLVAVAVCGNNKVEGNEQCDDGNTTDGDGCSPGCVTGPVLPVCGNNQVEDGEQCDDGNTADGDACTSTCQDPPPPAPVCGNDQVEDGEQCDDGNTADGDTCTSTCQTAMVMMPSPSPGPIDEVEDSGCGCATSGTRASGAEALLLLAVVLGLSRRRR